MGPEDGLPRRFQLVRKYDPTGISGTGIVADGVLWPNGWCSVMWRTQWFSLVAYPNLEHVAHIHGHNGNTRIVFVDVDLEHQGGPPGP